jgi:hypothetical protein
MNMSETGTYTVKCHRPGCGREYTFNIIPMWRTRGTAYCLCGCGLAWRDALKEALDAQGKEEE